MADTRTLKMTFGMSNGDDYDISVTNAKANLTKTTVDAVMQNIIDKNAIIKDGNTLTAIKKSTLITTTETVLE